MRLVCSWLLLFSWALWIGGQATLVLLIVTLFTTSKSLGAAAGPHIFPVFERYQLVLAGVAIIVSVILAILTRRRLLAIVIGCFILAGIGGVVTRTVTTPKMVELWQVNQAESPEFNTLHHRSELIYNVEFALLLVAGILLPVTLRGALRRESEDSREKGPPVEPADRVESA